MSGRRRTALAIDADRRNREQLARVGAAVRAARLRRRLTQAGLGARVGLGRMAISRAERGLGGGLTIDAWQRIGLALGMPLAIGLQRDASEEAIDGGHLAIQELVLRLARATGRSGMVELPTRPAEPWRSVDAAVADDRHRVLVVAECWNTFGDIGAAVRVSNRKAAEAEALAALRSGEASRGARLVWVVRATARNRALVARYPEVFAAQFSGSSAGWVRALRDGTEPPERPGLVWASVDGTRLWPWRRRRA
jgi:transcriptional regulator with XRE-family HTH domain